MAIRGDKRGLNFDPPHLLMYFAIAVVVFILVFLTISQIGNKEIIKESGDVEIFREAIIADLKPSLVTGGVVKEYSLPEGYDELCFVDVLDVDSGDIVDERKIKNNLLRGSRRNIFLRGDSKEVSFYVSDVSLPSFPHYYCTQSLNGRIEMQLDEENNEVVVKLPPNKEYCTNAQDKKLDDGSNLCIYLDEVYYQGYKEGCCQDYGYCC